jgi:hypothetical protein
MGMFDYVRCGVPLPDGFEGELQSKDFDCAMSTIEGDRLFWIDQRRSDDLRRVVHELEDWIRRATIEGAEDD